MKQVLLVGICLAGGSLAAAGAQLSGAGKSAHNVRATLNNINSSAQNFYRTVKALPEDVDFLGIYRDSLAMVWQNLKDVASELGVKGIKSEYHPEALTRANNVRDLTANDCMNIASLAQYLNNELATHNSVPYLHKQKLSEIHNDLASDLESLQEDIRQEYGA